MGEPRLARTQVSSDSVEAPRRTRRRRSRSRSASRGSVRRRRLRLVYFGLASFWGFTTGTGAVLVALASLGQPIRVEGATAALLVGAGLAAILGGCVASMAYHDASRRLR